MDWLTMATLPYWIVTTMYRTWSRELGNMSQILAGSLVLGCSFAVCAIVALFLNYRRFMRHVREAGQSRQAIERAQNESQLHLSEDQFYAALERARAE